MSLLQTQGDSFGERWQEALQREFQEELGVEVEVQGPPLVMENLYTHRGASGHEVLLIANVVFDATLFAHPNHIRLRENSGTCYTARWFDVAALRSTLQVSSRRCSH
ncbi:NUDIX domain-containing protein [Comamonas sp. MYb396]|uniref:NUDIX domain-containing protein n=1 Tax=Comamonas sp. MYb396 TaxID=2745302 RepID=UPI00309D96D6